jgi:hypothetical protein
MVSMILLVKDVLRGLELLCLLLLCLRQRDHMVVVPSRVLVMCHMANDLVTVALVLTSPTDHNFLLVVTVSLWDQGWLVFFLMPFMGRCRRTGIILSIITPVLCHLLTPSISIDVGRRPGEDMLMDSCCSRHMTRSNKWFSSLDLMICKEYITFQDKSRVKVVSNLHFNLLSVSQLLEDDYEVHFKKGLSRVLDAQGDLVC